MQIDIITCAPGLLDHLFSYGIIKRAIEAEVAEVSIHNLRDYGIGKHKQIDDAPYGGEAGMVLMLEPIVNCIEVIADKKGCELVVYLTPEGSVLDQSMANDLSLLRHIVFVCGHYKGVDHRLVDCLTTQLGLKVLEMSIGRFIVPGGELPAALAAHAIIRLLPGAISDSTSALTDSFQDGLIAPPVYTRPAVFRGIEVPSVLRSGDRKKNRGLA